ncbi:MAG: ABC transporter permease subunit [Myxococcales bacterium]|jgi:peptide/nickel transport system permease protein|nr:ABC transporter permease subunit [Myxococcales bacterium]
MLRFLLRRIVTLIPTVFGIALFTFILINLALDRSSAHTDTHAHALDASQAFAPPPAFAVNDDESPDAYQRALALHLPLFLNPAIEDIQTHTARSLIQLQQPDTRRRAIRDLIHRGAAVIPYLVPELPHLPPDARDAALEALEAIAQRIGNHEELALAEDPAAYWARYHSVYGSDYASARVTRLIRRLVRHRDTLALHELRRLDTFILPELMSTLADDKLDLDARAQLVGLLCDISGRNDPLPPGATAEQIRENQLRWQEWWHQRYDLYTAFTGLRRLTGTVTETRFFHWMRRVLTLDFGVSAKDGRPIRLILAKRLPITLWLSGLAMLLAYLVAIPTGIITAMKPGTRLDRALSWFFAVGYAVPSFWLAMLVLRFLVHPSSLSWLSNHDPSYLAGSTHYWEELHFGAFLRQLIVPVLCLSSVSVAMFSRFQRASMLRIAQADFVRTARAKGLSETQVIFRHALRSGLVPLVTLMAVQMPFLISGALVIEWMFGIPGMGLETLDAIRSADYTWLIAVVTVTAIITIVASILADILYALVDPRILPGRSTARSH